MLFYKNNFPEFYNKEKLTFADFIKVINFISLNINFKNNKILNSFHNQFKRLNKKPSRKEIASIIKEIIPKSKTNLEISYWTNRGFTEANAKKKISKIQKSRSYFGNPNINWDQSSFNYFLNKTNGNKELALKLYNEKNNKTKQTKENFIKRYGEIDGVIKWKSFLQKRKETSPFGDPTKDWDQGSLNYYINKYKGNKELALKLYNEKNNKTKQTKENFIKRYGETLGKEKWNNYKNKQAYVGVKKEYFIKKHGIELGLKKWSALIKKRKLYYTSKESIKYFIPIYKKLRKLGITRKDIFWGIKGSKEWFIRKEDSVYFYDFTIPKLNLIIEYHGEAFHPNPNWSNEKLNEWKQPFSNENYKFFLKKDKFKKLIAEEKNFILIEVFSSEKESKQKDIFKIIDDYESSSNR